MKQYFIYVWFDRVRKMYYVGSHYGKLDDGYTSSSRWLSGEIQYRPSDFRRRIIKICSSKEEMLAIEYKLISLIPEDQKGIRYYNVKLGRPTGITPWNKGLTKQIAPNLTGGSKKGRTAWNKNKTNPLAANNGKKGATKLSQLAKGRKRKYLPDGSWTWEYPVGCLDNKEQP
ncbi:MAG TPA: hypothetical protein VFM18_17765 [Methanosarcina sp.]|nr:hypothetical protein [Methanosarcina sp.]